MPAAVDAVALRRELEGALDGEVRFDALSRALYATDASVYQIEPIGVVLPKTRDDLRRLVDACRRHGCSITMRGGGTSQAGQAIGAGLVVDTSKYFNQLIDVDPGARWARVEPGIVLDDLNTALAPHRLRFAPDISTASRATVGGMISNNSAGARSVLYGKTIDHVLELQVLLSDGTFAWFRPVADAELRPAVRLDRRSKRRCYRRGAQAGARLCDGNRRGATRRFCDASAATTSTSSSTTASRSISRSSSSGRKGTLGIVVEATLNLVPLPAAKAVLVDPVRRSARLARRDANDSSSIIRRRSR